MNHDSNGIVSSPKYLDDFIKDSIKDSMKDCELVNEKDDSDHFLTREDLLELDNKEPKWRRIRLALYITVGVIWFGLLLASILIIIFTQKCPPRPNLPFWKSGVGYWVIPYAFKDSSENLIGDLKDSILSTKDARIRPAIVGDYFKVDSILGNLDDFEVLVRKCHKIGLKLVITLDFNSLSQVSRSGSAATNRIKGVTYYSAFGSMSIDLNLESSTTMEKVKGTNNNSWFSKYPTSQLFRNGSVSVIQAIREVIDATSSATGKPRVLIADSGNVGYGLQDKLDYSLLFLGSTESPGAHVIISREFVKSRGWKVNLITETWKTSSLSSYISSSGKFKSSLALTTATPTDPRYSSLKNLACTFLLPGSPILFFGSELGIEPTPADTYAPFLDGFTSYPVLNGEGSWVVNELPFPWGQSGSGYSLKLENVSDFSKYLENFGVKETLESALSVGRGVTTFQLIQQLITLRQSPSILWGDFTQLDRSSTVNDGIEAFVRSAEGFPKFIVILRDSAVIDPVVFDSSKECSSINPRFIYPPNVNIVLGTVIKNNDIYIPATDEKGLVYVFEC